MSGREQYTDANGFPVRVGSPVLVGNRFEPVSPPRYGYVLALFQDGDVHVRFYHGGDGHMIESIKAPNVCHAAGADQVVLRRAMARAFVSEQPSTKLDPKFYGEIRKVKDDSLVPDDEWVVFLAQDDAFPPTLEFYRQRCIELGADWEQIDGVNRMLNRVYAWRSMAGNQERCKTPDAHGEKMLT